MHIIPCFLIASSMRPRFSYVITVGVCFVFALFLKRFKTEHILSRRPHMTFSLMILFTVFMVTPGTLQITPAPNDDLFIYDFIHSCHGDPGYSPNHPPPMIQQSHQKEGSVG